MDDNNVRIDDIVLDNKYISIIYTIFHSYLYGQEVEVIRKEDCKLFGIIPYTKTVKEMQNLTVKDAHYQLDSFTERELSRTLDIVNFFSLWQFCQFVRFAEKVFFYRNDPDKRLYVDSDMNNLSKRAFKITKKDEQVEIYCNLEKVEDPINHKNISVIRLKVQRMFGKQMVNEFTIVDDYVKSKDSSDSLLIDNVFNMIAEEIKYSFECIMNRAIYIAKERKKNEKERK